jgi:integrase
MRKPTVYFGIDYKLTKGPHEGKYHIRMWVTFKDDNWNQVPYKTNVFCEKGDFKILNDWNRTSVSAVLQPQRDELAKIKAKATAIIEEFGITKQEKFDPYFASKYMTDSVALEFEKKMAELEAKKQFGTKAMYGNALNSFQAFFGADFTYSDCTPERLYEYEEWFINQERNSKNPNGTKKSISTVGFYMLPLRHIFNRKIKPGHLPAKMYPFGLYDDKYIIPSGRSAVKKFLVETEMAQFNSWSHATDEATVAKIMKQNRKFFEVRAIAEKEGFNGMKDFQRANILKSYALEKIEERNRLHAYARFSYYANGININDICRLKRSKVFKDHILVNRQKITRRNWQNREIIIWMHPVMQEIINKYGKRSLAPDDYVFPILDLTMSHEAIFKTIKTTVNDVNKVLALISKEMKFEIKMKSYTLRHSFSYALKQMPGYKREHLQDSLGHLDPRTTDAYDHGFSLEWKKQFGERL